MKYIFIYILHQEQIMNALHPLSQELVVDTDLDIWMQQDDSTNPSMIHAIRTDNMQHVTYTQVLKPFCKEHMEA